MYNYVVNGFNKKSRINKEIYGHFAEHLGRCIYEGIFVGEDSDIPNVNGMRKDVVEALKNINIPVLRWPGGCFADEYHWKDGIGPKETRKKMVNTHWGGVVEDNSFGTHEFMELCRQLETEPYINGNVGSGTVTEMEEWIEYMTFDGVSPMAELRKQHGREKPWNVKYFGIGNETWGCGGNMTPEYYVDIYRRYQTYVRNYGENKVYKIASGASDKDYNWTEVMMKNAGKLMDGLTLHHYTIYGDTWEEKGSATDFNESDWYKTLMKCLEMDEILEGHSRVMDKYDPEKRVGLIVDEWGMWFDVEPGTNPGFLYQQNTMRDALVAGTHFNMFNKHSDRVTMTNIAQTVNVLQSVVLTEGDKMLLTPTYHVYEMYKHHQDANLLDSYIETDKIGTDEYKIPNLHESASIDKDGNLLVTICNMDLEKAADINAHVLGTDKFSKTEATVLTGDMKDYNDFDAPEKVKQAKFDKYSLTDNGFEAKIPPCSIVSLRFIV